MELRDEPAAVDIDGQARGSVPGLVEEAEGRRRTRTRVSPPQPPTPFEGPVERTGEGLLVVVDGFSCVAAVQPCRKLPGSASLKADMLPARRVGEDQRACVEHEPRRLGAPVHRVSGNGRADVRQLNTRLMRATCLELQL